jgi:uncharacterized membrane protein
MSLDRWLPPLLVITGGVGLLAAALLMIERLRLLQDTAYVPMCSLNAVFNCGSVMTTPQASAFGIPNPLIGMIGFAVVLTTGMAMLAGACFRRWYWIGLQLGVTFAIGFVHWLIYQSLFRIEALCLYCMVVWVVTATLFWYVTVHNARTSWAHLPIWLKGIGAIMVRNHSAMLSLWGLVMAVVILRVFWL